jgi:hypothetical protein
LVREQGKQHYQGSPTCVIVNGRSLVTPDPGDVNRAGDTGGCVRMTSLFTTGNEAPHPRESQSRPPDVSVRSADPHWALIERSDDALLDIDTEAFELDIDHARALLAEHPTTYRNHLAIAKFIEGWVARITNDAKPCRFNDGFVEALLEMADHLRDGDFAVDEDDAVGYVRPAHETDIASTNGDLCARGRAQPRRRTVLMPTDLSGRATVIRARRAATPDPVDSSPTN